MLKSQRVRATPNKTEEAAIEPEKENSAQTEPEAAEPVAKKARQQQIKPAEQPHEPVRSKRTRWREVGKTEQDAEYAFQLALALSVSMETQAEDNVAGGAREEIARDPWANVHKIQSNVARESMRAPDATFLKEDFKPLPAGAALLPYKTDGMTPCVPREEVQAISVPGLAHESMVPFRWSPPKFLEFEQYTSADIMSESKIELYWVDEVVGWGARYCGSEVLPKNSLIALYSGEVINKSEQKRRMASEEEGYFIAALDLDLFVDARKYGAIGRFLNHRCVPNCKFELVLIDGFVEIGIFSFQEIAPGEVLTVDYQWSLAGERLEPEARARLALVECRCGALACVGRLFPDNKKDKLSLLKAFKTLF